MTGTTPIFTPPYVKENVVPNYSLLWELETALKTKLNYTATMVGGSVVLISNGMLFQVNYMEHSTHVKRVAQGFSDETVIKSSHLDVDAIIQIINELVADTYF